MSPSPSQLSEQLGPIVLDAGVLVNLLATTRAEEILRSLRRAVLVEAMSLDRLDGIMPRRTSRIETIRRLEERGFVEVQALVAESYRDFLDLVGAAPPDDLGDAQAGAVVLAAMIGAELVLDEPKVARIATQRLGREPLHTLDLIASPAVEQALGPDGVAGLLAVAARDALIRIPPRFRPWAAELLRLDVRTLDAPTAHWVQSLAPELRSIPSPTTPQAPPNLRSKTRSRAKRS